MYHKAWLPTISTFLLLLLLGLKVCARTLATFQHFLEKRFIYYMWVHCSCLQTHQKRASDPTTDGCEPPCGCWKLNPGNWTSGRADSALNRWAISPAPLLDNFKNGEKRWEGTETPVCLVSKSFYLWTKWKVTHWKETVNYWIYIACTDFRVTQKAVLPTPKCTDSFMFMDCSYVCVPCASLVLTHGSQKTA